MESAMKKIKLLYDIEQLLMSAGRETGICRVSLEVLKRISKQKEYEVYPIVTTKKGVDPVKYLEDKGLGYLVPNIVRMPYLKKTTQKYNLYKKAYCYFLTQKYFHEYMKQLRQYDEYLSLFSPISPIIYKSQIKTRMFIHDLIPLIMPETCSPGFVKKYRSWIKQVKADEVICVSDATKIDFFKFRPDYINKNTKVVYLAADSKFKPSKSNAIKEKYHIPTQKYFLAVSDHNPRKNFIHILNSFVKFLNQIEAKDISLVFAGPKGRHYEKLQEKIQNYPEYANKIICTGFVADSDMPALYSEATAFLYPSLYEGFGLPVLEAMQCGTPVITCHNSSLPEVGGDVALYVPETDAKKMAHVMGDLYSNPSKRQELSLKGLQRAQQFTWDKTTQQIFDLK